MKFTAGLLLTSALLLTSCASVHKKTDQQLKSSNKVIEQEVQILPGSQEDLVYQAGDRVYFGFDSSKLDSRAIDTLNKQCKWLQQNTTKCITVTGHCDQRGTKEYNIALGERRANAVKKYFVSSCKLHKDRIFVLSKGKEDPAVLGDTEEAYSKNRRAATEVNN